MLKPKLHKASDLPNALLNNLADRLRAGPPIVPKLRYFLTFSGVWLGWLWPALVEHIQLYVFLGVVGTIGMAHGSLDHLVHQVDQSSKTGMFRFYAAYLIATACVAVVWLMAPLLGLGLFIASSAYHFGQAEIPEHPNSSSFALWTQRFSWGMALLSLPVIVHGDALFLALQDWDLQTTPELLQVGGWASLLVAAVGYFGAARLGSRTRLRGEESPSPVMPLLAWLCYAVLLCVTPPLWGFTLYFGIWHAWPALEHVAKALKLSRARDWINALLPNYLPSFLATAAWVGLASLWAPEYTVAGLLVLLSALTVPHTVVFERLYRKG